jgi:hypothetical protein
VTLSSDEAALLVVAPLFLTAVGTWALIVHSRGKMLFETLRERIDPALWQELGAPASLRDAMRDPQGRWRRFMSSREYRRRLDTGLAALIDDYRSRGNRMLIVFGIAALLILYRFWPLLKPGFL